jgi:hypothetical protein
VRSGVSKRHTRNISGCVDTSAKVKRTGRDIEIDECKLLLFAWISAIIRGVSEAQKKTAQYGCKTGKRGTNL